MTDQQLLNHSSFEDLEILQLYGLDFDERKLLFDLVNELLIEIHRRSSVGTLRASLKEKPKVLEEVWKRVCWCQSPSSDAGPILG